MFVCSSPAMAVQFVRIWNGHRARGMDLVGVGSGGIFHNFGHVIGRSFAGKCE